MPIQPNADTAGSWLRQGVAYHQRGELKEAAALYRQVLALWPDHANALNLLGTVARQQGDLVTALRLIRRALALMPEAPVFLASLGGTLAEAGQLAEAVRTLREAVARRGQDVTALRNLGQALCGLRRPEEALAPLRRAASLAPAAAEVQLALAHAAREAGQVEEAIAAARRAEALPDAGPALAAQARLILAALGQGPVPDRAPAAYVRDLFDQYAPRFEADLEGRLGYRTPALLAGALAAAGIAADASREVLDLGCGTGLSGRALRPFARRMEGLDLSPRMLAEAARTGLYDALHEADLLEFLPRQPRRYGLIAAADVLNYLGELRPALEGMAAALAPGGVMAFSLERGEDRFALGEGLRYRHDPAAVRADAAAIGAGWLTEQAVTLRQERGQPVSGVLILLRVG